MSRSRALYPYARATRCPVLTQRMLLSAYALAMRYIAYGPISLRAIDYRATGTEIGYHRLSRYWTPPPLASPYASLACSSSAISGTEIAYAAVRLHDVRY
eukprot:1602441-Rhodomonas_salina.1